MEEMKEKYKNLHRVFAAYLHQDWTVEGSSLTEVFRNQKGLQDLAPKIHGEINDLLSEGHGNDYLDRLFVRKWHTGYEPDEDADEDWGDVLEQISRICREYMTSP
jgi:hypothetical protein